MLRVMVLSVFLAAFALPSLVAGEVTLDRLGVLSADERAAWEGYIKRSQDAAKMDRDVLRAEVERAGLSEALPVPSGGDFKIELDSGDDWYGGEEARTLADAVLSYQTPSGGWSKKTDYSQGQRQTGMQWSSQHDPGESFHYVATFDNRSTTQQIRFLANVWRATQREDCREAVVRGVDYILSAQYPNGGWPQVYPLEGDYHDNITYNDGVLANLLELLNDVCREEPLFAFIENEQRQRAQEALRAGIGCVLATQVDQGEVRTVWCGQHDPLTLQPVGARSMEPPTLSSVESAQVLKVLMDLRQPAPEWVECIEAGLAWLEQTRIEGLRKTKVDGRTVYVDDPEATKVYWARFYDLAHSRPVFPGRDGVLYESFNAMAANNDLGYDYYSTRPGSVVRNGQKKWRKMLGQ